MIYMIFIVLVLILIWVSLLARMSIYRPSNLDQINVKQTQLSQSVQDLVSTAGGVYLSIIMLTSFLRLEVPEKLNLAGIIEVDPIAFFSLVLAIFQPLISRFWKGM